MEKMNKDIPYEHQMISIIRDYDSKVEEVTVLRKKVKELTETLAVQSKELKQAKKELKQLPSLKDKALQLESAMRKKEQLSKKVDMLLKSLVFVRNQMRHLLAMVDVPSLRELEQRMSETLKKCED